MDGAKRQAMAKRAIAKTQASDASIEPQVQMLLLSLTNVVEQMVQEKCGELSKRDRSTLQRRILKAIRQFVRGCGALR
jgi:hypothetical protein